MSNDTTLQSLFDHAKKPAQDPSLGLYPKVFATFVEQCANLHPQGDPTADLVIYAHGELKLSSNQKALSGELQIWRNKFNPGGPPFFGSPATPPDAFADVNSPMTIVISVNDVGQATLQKKLNGNPSSPPVPMNADYNSGLFVEQFSGTVRNLSFTLA
jgi:hypothetical protein